MDKVLRATCLSAKREFCSMGFAYPLLYGFFRVLVLQHFYNYSCPLRAGSWTVWIPGFGERFYQLFFVLSEQQSGVLSGCDTHASFEYVTEVAL